LASNAEDLTINSEDLNTSHISVKKVKKASGSQRFISKQHTSQHDGILYLEDGTEYEGYYHVHLKDNSAMTGKYHTQDSQDLFYKQIRRGVLIDKLVPTRNTSGVLPANRLKRKYSKGKVSKPRIKRQSRSGGSGGGGGY